MTRSVKTSEIPRRWWVIDASGKTLGKVATEAASLLQGKGKPSFARHLDVGDFVIVVNAAKVKVTGKKSDQKVYYHHTLYPGGLKAVKFSKMLKDHPVRPLEHAIKGMLPHTRLGRAMARRLKVYAGDNHPHQAQVKVRREEQSG